MRRLVVAALVVAAGTTALPALVAPSSNASLVINAVQGALLVAGLVVGVLALATGRSARPTGFVVRGGAFAVPASRAFGYVTIGLLLLAAFLAGQAADNWVHPDRGHARLLEVLSTTAAGLWAALAVSLTVRVLRDQPVLELTPRGLLVRDFIGSRMFPWDALRPGTPMPGYDAVSLVIDRPELVRRSSPVWPKQRIMMTYALVHPWFFADAVRLYGLRAERRAAIGTPEEFTRLLVDLGVLVPVS